MSDVGKKKKECKEDECQFGPSRGELSMLPHLKLFLKLFLLKGSYAFYKDSGSTVMKLLCEYVRGGNE